MCWGNRQAPWVNASAFVGAQLLEALIKYGNTTNVNKTFSIHPGTDFASVAGENITALPEVPDVLIQYRCGDNIDFSRAYGVLPFTAFPSRIPLDAKYIYVLSDHPSRAPHSAYSGRCHIILEALFTYLKESRPDSVVVVKRGGDIFVDLYRMAHSPVLICSASTFCFWPALANVQRGGQVHFPFTSLIAGAYDSESAPKTFGANFHWINDSSIISNFGKLRPWTKIISILRGDNTM